MVPHRSTIIVSVVILLTAVSHVACSNDESWNVYYVKPSEAEQCSPHFQPCYTVQFYVNNSNFSSNSTFLFLKGLHILHGIAEIRNATNLALIGVGPEKCKIQRKGPAGLFFREMIHGNLTISNLTFSNCGAESADGLPCGALLLDTVFDLNLTNVIVENTTGYGLLGFNLLGNSFIINSIFKYNVATQDCDGGNTLIFYNNFPNHDTTAFLIITSSQFFFGKHPLAQRGLSWGSGGLTFVMGCPNVSVHATDLILYSNEGRFGGNLFFHFMLFTNISITLENSYVTAGSASRGGGALVVIDEDVVVKDKYSCGGHSLLHQKHQLLYFSNVTFDHNRAQSSGAGIEVEHQTTPGYFCTTQLVVIDNSVFTNNILPNSWFGGEAVRLCTNPFSLVVYDTHTKLNIQVEFRNTVFKNHMDCNNLYEAVSSPVLSIESYTNITFANCTFIDNQATVIRAFQTNVIFEGNSTFQCNSGVSGAGLALFMNSYMYLKPHTNLLFVNNHALSAGGAIYTDLTLQSPRLVLPCFFQVLTEGQGETLSTIRVEFMNNTAGVAGSSLYGGYLDSCQGFNGLDTGGLTAFKKIFHYNTSNPAVVASDPVSVCFCSLTSANTLEPNCQNKKSSVTVYPGELFHILVVLEGQMNGTVPGVVHASFRNGNNTASLGSLQESQTVNGTDCTFLNLTIFSTHTSATLILFARLEFQDYETAQLVVSFRQCPLAFVLSPVS